MRTASGIRLFKCVAEFRRHGRIQKTWRVPSGAMSEVGLRLIKTAKDVSSTITLLAWGCPHPFVPEQKADLNPPRSPGSNKPPIFHQRKALGAKPLQTQPGTFSWVSLKFPKPSEFCDVSKCFIIFCCQLGAALGFVVIQKEGTTSRAFLFPGKGLPSHKMMRFQ